MDSSLNDQDLDWSGGNSCVDWMQLFGGQLLTFPEPPLSFDVIDGSVLQQDLTSASGDRWLSGTDPNSAAVDGDGLLQDSTWSHTVNVGDSSGLFSADPGNKQHSTGKFWQRDEDDEDLKCIDMYSIIVEQQPVLDSNLSNMLLDNVNEFTADEAIDLSSFDVIGTEPELIVDDFRFLSEYDSKLSTGSIGGVTSTGNSGEGLMNDVAKLGRMGDDYYIDSTDVSSELMSIMSNLSNCNRQHDASANISQCPTTATVSFMFDFLTQSQSSLSVSQDSLAMSGHALQELHSTVSQNSLASQASLEDSAISSNDCVTSKGIRTDCRQFAAVSKITCELGSTPTSKSMKPYKNIDRLTERKLRKKEQNCRAALRYRQKKRDEKGHVMTEVEKMEQDNERLRTRAEELSSEIEYLKRLMDEIRKQ